MNMKDLITLVMVDVVAFALLPVLASSIDSLTGVGGTYESTTTGDLIDLVPIIFVIVILAGNVAYVVFKR